MFQVTHYARSNLHDRYLTSIFMTDILPVRPFFIKVPADDVWQRRVEHLGMASGNAVETTESGTKRIFRKLLHDLDADRDPAGPLHRRVARPGRCSRPSSPWSPSKQFDILPRTFLDRHPDPLNEFSQDERDEGGELFTVVHEGEEMPTAQ